MQRTVIRIANGIANDTETFTFDRNAMLHQLLLSVKPENMDAINDALLITVELNPRQTAPNSETTEQFSATLAVLSLSQQFLTSGGGVSGQTIVVPLKERISLGDRIRVHVAAGGGAQGDIECILYTS